MADDPNSRKYAYHKTIFVVELISNGAGSSFENNVDSVEFFGVNKGLLTDKGRRESSRIGAKRKQEYQKEKQLIGVKFNPHAIISLSLSEDRSYESANHIL